MIQDAIDEAKKTEIALEEFIEVLSEFKALDESRIEPTDPVTSKGLSLSELITSLENSIALVAGVSDTSDLPVPQTWLRRVIGSFRNIRNETEQIKEDIKFVSDNGGVQTIDKGDVTIRNPQNNQARQLQQRFSEIDSHNAALLEAACLIRLATRSDKVGAFEGLQKATGNALARLERARKSIVNIKKSAQAQKTSAENAAKQATEHADQISNVQTEVQQKLATIEGNLETTHSLLINVQEVRDNAEHLRGEINSYQGEFETFQKQLSERNSEFTRGKAALDKLVGTKTAEVQGLIEDANAQKTEHQRLTDESTALLGLATSAGLANSYARARADLDKPIQRARMGFYLSIVFMLFSILVVFNAIPLVSKFIVFPSAVLDGQSSTANAVINILAATSTRLLVLLPSFILVAFASRRHRSLFRLQEEYRHKETIAASVASFKEQAGEAYENAVAALAFESLMPNPNGNPGESQDSGSPNGPISRWLRKILRKELSAMLAVSPHREGENRAEPGGTT